MKGWEIKKIGEVCTIKSGITVKSSLEKSSGDVPYLKVSDMTIPGNNLEITTSSRFLDREDFNKKSIFPVGTTIFPKRGGAILTNKKRLTAIPICADLNIMGIIPSNALIPKFLYYYFLNIDMRKLGSGSSIPQINNYDIEPLTIFYPLSLTEQKQIVAILDEAFEGIDAAIANTEKNLANARELFESYLNGVFTQKGEGWVEKKFSEILAVQPRNGWSPPAKNHSDSGIPVLTLSSVTGFEFDKNKIKFTNAPTKKDAHYWLKEGEFLITRSNTTELVGHVAICHNLDIPTICCDLIMKMQVDTSQVNCKFIYWYFRTARMRELISSSAQGANPTMKKINKSIVQNLPVIFPSTINTQTRIAIEIDTFYFETQRLESIYQRKLEALKELKQSILEKAFTGELTSDMAKEVADTSKEAAA